MKSFEKIMRKTNDKSSNGWRRKDIRQLRLLLQPPFGEEEFYYLYRLPSIYFTKLFLILGLTANQVTWFGSLVGITGSLLWCLNSGLWKLVGVIFLYMFEVFDHSDGEVARARDGSSTKGVFYELLGHSVMKSFIFVGFSIGMWRIYGDSLFLILGYFCSIGLFLTSIVRYHGLRAAVERGIDVSFKETGVGKMNFLVKILNFPVGDLGIIFVYFLFTIGLIILSNAQILLYIGKLYLVLFITLSFGKFYLQTHRVAHTVSNKCDKGKTY